MSIQIVPLKSKSTAMLHVVSLAPVNISLICPSCLSETTTPHACGTCLQCCTCELCSGCFNVIVEEQCTACNLCQGCCKCYACSRCGAAHTHKTALCTSCGGGVSGANGCGCCIHQSGRSAERLLFKQPVNLDKYKATLVEHLQKNPSTRLIAAELEICGIHGNATALATYLKSWGCSVVGDGSLPSGGFEINTHPASGDFFLAQISDICQGLKLSKAWVDQRAGAHTHIDAHDLGYLGISRVMRLVACLEPAFFMLIPEARRKSQYCGFYTPKYLQAIHNADALTAEFPPNDRRRIVKYRDAITQTLYGSTGMATVQDARTSKGGGNRYRAVNLHSWFYRGTLEFRMPPGTIYESNIVNWGLMLANIVEIGATYEHRKLLDVTREVEQAITKNGMYITNWSLFSPRITEMSIELLKTLAPNLVVKDWITERVKLMKQNNLPSLEAY